jgi:energy-coupling factor transporter ATP-binding protein EcfA2
VSLEFRSLVVENIKQIKVVSINAVGQFIQITGANGAGKSSVLDGVAYALTGKKSLPEDPVRDGQEHGRVRLDLGELVIKWRVSAGNKIGLQVENADGAKFSSPQAILDSIRGELAFDPIHFSRMKPRDQYEAIKGIVKLDVDLEQLERQNAVDYANRTNVNREAEQLRTLVDAVIIPPDAPTKAEDTQELVAELRAIDAHNQAVANAAAKLVSAIAQRDNADKEVRRIQNDLAFAEHLFKECEVIVEKHDLAVAVAGKRKDAEAQSLQTRLAGVKFHNEQVQRRVDRANLEARWEEKSSQANALTEIIDGRKKQKEDAITSAKMPVAGLGFGDGFLMFNGKPFSQASSSEKLRTGVAVAMAANPRLRMLLIRDGNLLDEKSLQVLEEMTTAEQYTVLIERVDTSGKVGVYLEDGMVAVNNYGSPTHYEPETIKARPALDAGIPVRPTLDEILANVKNTPKMDVAKPTFERCPEEDTPFGWMIPLLLAAGSLLSLMA